MKNIESFEDLVGHTLLSAAHVVNRSGEHEFRMSLTDGRVAVLYHGQDCCERVALGEVHGDLGDIVDAPILRAEESVSGPHETEDGTGTWTFYRLTTAKGHVTLRWCGESNGYYSESVDFRVDDAWEG